MHEMRSKASRYIMNLPNSEKFVYVGTKSIPTENETLSLEVFCRNYRDQDLNTDELEIIINDVTNAKQVEEKKSEMK